MCGLIPIAGTRDGRVKPLLEDGSFGTQGPVFSSESFLLSQLNRVCVIRRGVKAGIEAKLWQQLWTRERDSMRMVLLELFLIQEGKMRFSWILVMRKPFPIPGPGLGQHLCVRWMGYDGEVQQNPGMRRYT